MRLIDSINRNQLSRTVVLLLMGVALLFFVSLPKSAQAQTIAVPGRSIIISDATPSATNVTYKLQFDLTVSRTLGSIQFEFCSNNPLLETGCTAPTGFSMAGATFSGQSGETGFTVDGASTANNVILTRSAVATTPGTVEYFFDDVVNADVEGTQYVRITVYSSIDATGVATDGGGLAFSLDSGLSLGSEVPPYLLFCSGETITGTDCLTATGSNIDLGILKPDETATATAEFVVATNADDGYNVNLLGTTLTSGSFIIDALPTPTASTVGIKQFGFNLRNNNSPNVGSNAVGPGLATPSANYNTPNRFMFLDGDVIAMNNNESDVNKFTTSFISNISEDADPGYYAATLSFVVTASF